MLRHTMITSLMALAFISSISACSSKSDKAQAMSTTPAPAPEPNPGANSETVMLDIQLLKQSDESPLINKSVKVKRNGEDAEILRTTDAEGKANFGTVKTGSYIATIYLTEGEDPIVYNFSVFFANIVKIRVGTETTNPTDPVLVSASINECTMAQGQTSCVVNINWSVLNAPNAGIRYRMLGQTETQRICLSGSPCQISANEGTYEVFLHVDGNNANSALLASKTVSITKESSTGGGSEPVVVSAQLIPCAIAQGQGSCVVNINWNVLNAPNAGIRYRVVGQSQSYRICLNGSPCQIPAGPGQYEVGLMEDADNPNSRMLESTRVDIH